MNIYAFTSLFVSVLCFLVGNYVFYQNRKSLPHLLFAIVCIATSYIGFCEFMFRQAESDAIAALWIKCISIWPFVPALLLHFSLAFSEYRAVRRPIIPLLIYGMALFLSLLAFIHIEPSNEYWGYTYNRQNPFIVFVGVTGAFAFILLSFIILLRYYFAVTDHEKKQQVKYILAGMMFPCVASLLCEGVSPLFNIKAPEASISAAGIFVLISVYAIRKHRLFQVNPATASENILAIMNDLLFLTDAGGHLIRVNRALCDTLGYHERELIGMPASLLFADQTAGTGVISNALGGTMFRDHDVELKTRTGEIIASSLSSSILKANQGRPAGLVGIARNIKERKAGEKALREIDRFKDEFLSIATHEMKTPIQVVSMSVEMISMLHPNDPETQKEVSLITKQLKGISRLVFEILDYAKMQAGFWKIHKMEHAFDQVVQDAVQQIIPLAKQIVFEAHGKQADWTVACDDEQIKRVVKNLLSNAVKYNPPGTNIAAHIERTAEGVCCRVEDSGVGIASENQLKIFDRFYGNNGRTNKKIHSLGLGLPICKRIIELHGGAIRAESEGLGKGTRFIFTIPSK